MQEQETNTTTMPSTFHPVPVPFRFGISTSNPSRAGKSLMMIPTLHVHGNCLETVDAVTRQEVFAKVEHSVSHDVRFSSINSVNDMTQLLQLVQTNSFIEHVEIDSCSLTGDHLERLPKSAKLVSCSIVGAAEHESDEATPTTTTRTTTVLQQHCARNTQLQQLHIHDVVLDRSMAYSLRTCFCFFPYLQSFALVACHLTDASYAALTVFLHHNRHRRSSSPSLTALSIDLRVWSQVALHQHGLAQAIGACDGLTDLQLNGRILEQVSIRQTLLLLLLGQKTTTTTTTTCATAGKRLRLTFRADEIQGDGFRQLGELIQATAASATHTHLQAVDVSELGNVSTLSFFDYEDALAAFMEAAILSKGEQQQQHIETLYLPKLSSTLSRCLAACVSQAASAATLRHLSSPGMVWSPTLETALRHNSSLVYVAGGFRDATTKRRIQHYVRRNQALPQLLLWMCGGTGCTESEDDPSVSERDDAAVVVVVRKQQRLLPRAIVASRYSHASSVVQALMEIGDHVPLE